MTRVLVALLGVILLAVTALATVWLVGQVLSGLAAFLIGASVVLWKLLWFVVIGGVLSGLVYFVTSAWRPARPAPPARPFGLADARDVTLGEAVVPPATQRLVVTPDLPPARQPDAVEKGP